MFEVEVWQPVFGKKIYAYTLPLLNGTEKFLGGIRKSFSIEAKNAYWAMKMAKVMYKQSLKVSIT